METRTKILAGSLAGATAIHLMLAACSGDHPGGGREEDASAARITDALLDVFRGNDARGADDAGTTSCSCTSTSPADDPAHWVSGSVQFPLSNAGGAAIFSVAKVADGPFVLRHIHFSGFNNSGGTSFTAMSALYLASDGQCGAPSSVGPLIQGTDATKHLLASGVASGTYGPVVPDEREVWIAVPSGSALCAGLSFIQGGVAGFSGFRP